ncbi:hypothetical protein FHS96_005286 [Sphingomonas zeicaulis]|uniref:lasso peptide biosynthesis B2 protein n=1 Tax=Sphingomonas zeicaulis TaxID=1632740 RepID=UPI003D2412B5
MTNRPASTTGPMPASLNVTGTDDVAQALHFPLAPGVHAAFLEGGVVFLDLTRDEYVCIAFETDALEDLPQPIIADLADAGILASIDPGRRRHVQAERRRWRDQPPMDVSIGCRDVVCFIRALLITGLRFRGRTVADLLATAASAKITSPAVGSAGAVAARFERMLLFVPFRFRCLFRSYFLTHLLAQYGHRADWIFGVSLFPFRAHCWLAQGPLLIGEDASRLLDYVPILIAQHPSR